MNISNRPLDILVIGAGIAGLSAAIALGKQGHRVVVCCHFQGSCSSANQLLSLPDFGEVGFPQGSGRGNSLAAELYSIAQMDGCRPSGIWRDAAQRGQYGKPMTT